MSHEIMIPRFGGVGRNVNPSKADEVFLMHEDQGSVFSSQPYNNTTGIGRSLEVFARPSTLLCGLHEHTLEHLLDPGALALRANDLLRAVFRDLLDALEVVPAFFAGVVVGGHLLCSP